MSQILIHAAEKCYDSVFINVEEVALNMGEMLKQRPELKGAQVWFYIEKDNPGRNWDGNNVFME